MTAAHPLFAPSRPADTDEYPTALLRDAINRLFLRRTRVALAAMLGGELLFAAVDLFGQLSRGAGLYELRAFSVVLIACAYALSRQRALLPYATAFAWMAFSAACTLMLLTGVVSNVVSGAAPFLYVLFAFAAGALFPWGVRVQLSAAAVAALAFGLEVYWRQSQYPFITYQAAEGVVLSLITSVICASSARSRLLALMQDSAERQRAEDGLRESNRHLDQRVQQRLDELEHTKRNLAQQVADTQRAAATLRESEDLLQAIVDNSSAIIYLKDLDGRYLLINAQYSRVFGKPVEGIVGKSAYDMHSVETADRMLANDRQVLAANRAIQFEEAVPQDDGVHTYISVKFPVRDPNGTPYGVCGISSDITERKRTESALRHSQFTLSTIIEHSDEGIWALDGEFRVQLLNSVARQRFPQAYGRHPEIGMDFRDLLPADARAYWGPRFQQALSGERVVQQITLASNGETQEFLASLNPIVDATGITGVTIFVKDITPLKRAEEQARQHRAELEYVLRRSTMDELAAELAHEINQPLGAIVNYAQGCARRLQVGSVDVADLGHAIDQITCEAQRAGEVLERLQHTVFREPNRHTVIDVNQVVRDAARAIEFRCTGVLLHLDLAEDLPAGHGDAIGIEQAVLNLLHNAIEALQGVPSEARRLAIATRLAAGAAIEVAVSDTGPGVDPDVAARLFQPFFTTKSDGLGMGLAISRSIVEAHGGKLWLAAGLEPGCTFRFTLPAHDVAGGDPPSPTPERS